MTYRVRVKMRDAAGHWSHWSAPVQFVSGAPDVSFYQQNLVVSELMYKPNGGSDYEFIELRNLSTTTALDLTPVTISGGVDYAFPSMSLAAGARVIVPKNLAVFQSRYGTALPTVAGWGPNDSLNNSGDTITLNYGQDAVIRSFTYQPVAPWPDLTALIGNSIVLKIPGTTAPDHTIGTNWRASLTTNGNPGNTDAITFTGTPTADTDADGLNALLEYALGTSDTNNATGPTAYSITREPAGTFLFLHQRVLAADDITYTLQATTDLTAPWSPADAAFVNSTPVATGIVSDTWRITPPLGAVKFFVRLRVVR